MSHEASFDLRNPMRTAHQEPFEFAAEMAFEQDPTAGKHGGNLESIAAFDANTGKRSADRKLILGLLERGPATPKELARKMRKQLNAVSGRFSELKKDGLIEPTDQVRDGSRELRLVKGDSHGNE